MSYRRSFSKVISVPYSGTAYKTVTFSAGNTSHTETVAVHYSGTVQENVVVNVDIDTDPFDASVGQCNNNIGLLTGSVVATEMAQVDSIRQKAIQIGDTVVQGFFRTVKSEISQQIAELSIQIDATLLHLKELAQRCISKQAQMENDYGRLCKRYTSVFDDFNHELENRIHEIDKPVFAFRKIAGSNADRSLESNMAGIIAVAGPETHRLEAIISASKTKKRALETMGQADRFLLRQRHTDRVLDKCSISSSGSGAYYAPVCFFETRNEDSLVNRELYVPEMLEKIRRNRLLERLSRRDWWVSREDIPSLRTHYEAQVEAKYSSEEAHDKRVREYMINMFKNTIR